MKKILCLLLLSVAFLWGSVNLNSASKKELMSIKGIGAKKAEAIIQYRKKNRIKNAEELSKLKGFGPKLIKNIKQDIKSKRSSKKRKAKASKTQSKS